MQKVFLILFVGVLGVCVYMHEQESPIVNDVLLKNVDALADKVANGPTTCWCSGSYTCPVPGEIIVCSGGNGSRKECMCRNEYECTPSPCQ